MIRRRSFATRLTLALALLLLGFAAMVALLGRHVAAEHEQESLQRLSHGLARHIVEHWPAITESDPDQAEQAARVALLSMLMVVNPGVQVYVLDADGRVAAYIGEPGMVRQPQVDLQPVREFLAGAALPLRGTDPMGSAVPRIFSAAMFAPRPGEARPPGYLYVVLDGQAREQVAGRLSLRRVWLGAAIVASIGLVALLATGALAMRQITRPLRRLASRIQDYGLSQSAGLGTRPAAAAPGSDEVRTIAAAFDAMTQRLEATAAREQRQVSAHREMMASVAHDLRTPLTALHGHLEALAGKLAAHQAQSATQPAAQRADQSDADAGADLRMRLLAAALTQSDKVRRLSQQLFELAALQSTDQVLHRERFRLDELVTDAVQKFELSDGPPAVTLGGESPGRLEFDGDLQLIERALNNLIDNAMRHAPGNAPVRVSVKRDGALAQILVEDMGPGLPADLLQRLEQGLSLREPPLKRPGGGIGGLGLAIAQRVAILHGGSLRPLPALQGGTRMCLALPLAS